MKGPLIGLGFAKTIDDVKRMIDVVDLDGSGQIEFSEFLAIIKNTGGDPNS
jgi:Ca2+-binding EF-hand superfamily protein